MSEETINNTYYRIIELIRHLQLKDVIAQIQVLLEKCPDWDLQTSLEQVDTSYKYMLQYMIEGIVDPKRKELYENIIIRLTEIADRIHILLLDYESSRLYHVLRNRIRKNAISYDLMRTVHQLESTTMDISINSLLPDEEKQIDTARQLYQYEKELFTQTWINITWSNEEEEAADYTLQSSTLSQTDLCLFIGAVTMSLLECLDVNKLLWLFKIYMQQTSQCIKQRAMIGIFFILHIYSDRIHYYPSILNRISLLKDQPDFIRDFTQCYINFINCRETEKITQIMNNEIVPGILKDMNFSFPPSDNNNEEDENPHLIFPNIEDEKLAAKLERLTRMSMEGGDLYMSTFQNLKGFPFFHEIENWFKPFDMNQPDIIKLLNPDNDTSSTILNIIRDVIYLCDNDKYSLAYLLPKMPMAQFNLMKEQLQQAEEAMKEEEGKDEVLTEDEKAYKLENGNYIHDLYRFFKVGPRKNEFINIFKLDIFSGSNKDLNKMIYGTDNLIILAEFLLKKKYWKEAGILYGTLIEINKKEDKNGILYSRLGYSHQKQKMYSSAIQYYKKAEFFLADDNWLKEQMAICYRMSEQYNDALSYYQEIEKVYPDNINIVFNIGLCLAELRQYDEALKYFFKIDFLQPDNIKAWRAIGWYSILCNKLDQAQTYYDRIIEKSPDTSDYLNAGHVQWLKGNIREAIKNYRSSLDLCKNKEEFLMLFRNDISVLVKGGIDQDIIPLILDII